ncbi:MAG: nickel pincer cofactor biosynthesis protein LarB [Lacipirellulaceae bacterium]
MNEPNAPHAGQERLAGETVTLDTDRARRCGYPEVVYGEGKSVEMIAAVFDAQRARGERSLATRVVPDVAAAVAERLPNVVYNAVARTLRSGPSTPEPTLRGLVAVVTAGSTDLPVAEEACETLAWMGVLVRRVNDVGVAGPHRLPARLAEFDGIDAVVVAAGMEGALPSVVGGHLACPVIAVPTSVGYGANLGGIAALLSMLNSCASNVAVVNIDAGFKAGYMAGLIAQRAATRA